MLSAPSLSIVILNYNTCALLCNCVRAALREAPQAEIIVVDNASTDDSAATVAAQFPTVTLLAQRENIGFARGMNLGLRAAHGDQCLCLNADTELLADTLPALQAQLAAHARVGIVGPTQYLPPTAPPATIGPPLASVFPDPTLGAEALRLLFFADAWAARLKWGPWRAPAGSPRPVDWLMGAALLLRRECFNAVQGFDEGAFMYGEDWDLCYRARQKGWQVQYVPTARILHHENAAGKTAFGPQRMARVLTGNLHFHEKHYGRRSRRALALLHWVGAGLRLALLLVAGPQRPTVQARWQAQVALAQVAWRSWQAPTL